MQEITECDLRTPWAGPGIWSRVAVGGEVINIRKLWEALDSGENLGTSAPAKAESSTSPSIRPLEELLICRKLPVLGDLPSAGRFGSICTSFVERGYIEESKPLVTCNRLEAEWKNMGSTSSQAQSSSQPGHPIS